MKHKLLNLNQNDVPEWDEIKFGLAVPLVPANQEVKYVIQNILGIILFL
jgi:hypothetical protein